MQHTSPADYTCTDKCDSLDCKVSDGVMFHATARSTGILTPVLFLCKDCAPTAYAELKEKEK